MSQWSQRAADDSRLTVAARIGVLVLTVFAAPAASWSVLQIIDLGRHDAVQEQRLGEIEKRAITYNSEDARRDLAIRDLQIVQLASAVDKLVRVVEGMQEKQSARLPLFDQLIGRVQRLEDRIFGTPMIGQPR